MSAIYNFFDYTIVLFFVLISEKAEPFPNISEESESPDYTAEITTELVTPFDMKKNGENIRNRSMFCETIFEVEAFADVMLYSIGIYTDLESVDEIQVWKRYGELDGSEFSSPDWTLMAHSFDVPGNGLGAATFIPSLDFNPTLLENKTTHSIRIGIASPNLLSTPQLHKGDEGDTTITTSDDSLSITHGFGVKQCSAVGIEDVIRSSLEPLIVWNGALQYRAADITPYLVENPKLQKAQNESNTSVSKEISIQLALSFAYAHDEFSTDVKHDELIDSIEQSLRQIMLESNDPLSNKIVVKSMHAIDLRNNDPCPQNLGYCSFLHTIVTLSSIDQQINADEIRLFILNLTPTLHLNLHTIYFVGPRQLKFAIRLLGSSKLSELSSEEMLIFEAETTKFVEKIAVMQSPKVDILSFHAVRQIYRKNGLRWRKPSNSSDEEQLDPKKLVDIYSTLTGYYEDLSQTEFEDLIFRKMDARLYELMNTLTKTQSDKNNFRHVLNIERISSSFLDDFDENINEAGNENETFDFADAKNSHDRHIFLHTTLIVCGVILLSALMCFGLKAYKKRSENIDENVEKEGPLESNYSVTNNFNDKFSLDESNASLSSDSTFHIDSSNKLSRMSPSDLVSTPSSALAKGSIRGQQRRYSHSSVELASTRKQDRSHKSILKIDSSNDIRELNRDKLETSDRSRMSFSSFSTRRSTTHDEDSNAYRDTDNDSESDIEALVERYSKTKPGRKSFMKSKQASKRASGTRRLTFPIFMQKIKGVDNEEKVTQIRNLQKRRGSMSSTQSYMSVPTNHVKENFKRSKMKRNAASEGKLSVSSRQFGSKRRWSITSETTWASEPARNASMKHKLKSKKLPRRRSSPFGRIRQDKAGSIASGKDTSRSVGSAMNLLAKPDYKTLDMLKSFGPEDFEEKDQVVGGIYF